MSVTTADDAGIRSAEAHFLGGNLTLADCGFEALTLPHIMTTMRSDEAQWKSFYTLFLGLTWSDTPINKEENPFAEEYEVCVKESLKLGIPIEYDLAHHKDDDLKDPRFAADQPALLTLNLVRFYPQVVFRRAIHPHPRDCRCQLSLQIPAPERN